MGEFQNGEGSHCYQGSCTEIMDSVLGELERLGELLQQRLGIRGKARVIQAEQWPGAVVSLDEDQGRRVVGWELAVEKPS